jgi:uncharacterized protein DUF6527
MRHSTVMASDTIQPWLSHRGKRLRLTDLEPKLVDGARGKILIFWCPVCKGEEAHKIRVPVEPEVDRHGQSWKSEGKFPDTLTLQPSVNAGCWHGNITNGMLVDA